MKTHKSHAILVGILALCLVMLASCNTPEPSLEPGPMVVDRPDIHLEGQLHAWNQTQLYNEDYGSPSLPTTLTATGSADVDAFDNLELRQTHVAVLDELDQNVSFIDGRFELTGIEGNTLYGSYSGNGKKIDDNYFSASLYLIVEGGTGLYEGAWGSLVETITPHDGAIGVNIMDVTLDGDIFMPRAVDQPIEP